MQQALRDQLNSCYQALNESLVTFFQRICHNISLAEYPAAVVDLVAETSFMNGLHLELASQVRTSPVTLNLQGKVDYAQRIWLDKNPQAGGNVFQQSLAPHLQQKAAIET